MKVFCPQCDELFALESFRLDAGVLVVSCSRCGTELRTQHRNPVAPRAQSPVTLTAAALDTLRPTSSPPQEMSGAQPPPFEAPPGFCAKCVSKLPASVAACPSCGLIFNQASPEAYEPSEWLRLQWLSLSLPTQWGSPQQHEQLRAEAVSRGELASLGRLYRVRLAHVPDDQFAAQGRDEVLRLAMLPSAVSPKVTAKTGTPPWQYALAVLALLVSLAASAMLLRTVLTTQP